MDAKHVCEINSDMLQRLTKLTPGYNNLRHPQLQQIFKNRNLYSNLANKDLEAFAKIIQETFDNLQSYYLYLCENDLKGKNGITGLFRLSIQREQNLKPPLWIDKFINAYFSCM